MTKIDLSFPTRLCFGNQFLKSEVRHLVPLNRVWEIFLTDVPAQNTRLKTIGVFASDSDSV